MAAREAKPLGGPINYDLRPATNYDLRPATNAAGYSPQEPPMKILVLGGDGFCGWPTALHLPGLGHDVLIVDNLSRRRIDTELGSVSLAPIRSIEERIAAWHSLSEHPLRFVELDVCRFDALLDLLAAELPATVVYFAEPRAAPYSMKSPALKNYTVHNNVNATHWLLNALVETGGGTHLVDLGTMGVYGYGHEPVLLPDGYLDVPLRHHGTGARLPTALSIRQPGAVYHMTKVLDAQMFQFYAKNDELRITDIHQGIVWGTQTEQTRRDDERLTNRFDYDGDYGTVINRFLMQAAVGHPLTVYGTGGQMCAFIHIQETCRCIQRPSSTPPRGRPAAHHEPDGRGPPPAGSRRDGPRDDRVRDFLPPEPAQRARRKRPVGLERRVCARWGGSRSASARACDRDRPQVRQPLRS